MIKRRKEIITQAKNEREMNGKKEGRMKSRSKSLKLSMRCGLTEEGWKHWEGKEEKEKGTKE